MLFRYFWLILAIAEGMVISHLLRKLKCQTFMFAAKAVDEADARNKLLDKLKEKIELTQRHSIRRLNKDELLESYIYKQDNVQQLMRELHAVYGKEMATLKGRFAQLTDLDIVVLGLLSTGMDNAEICELMRMEKRTLYRRRQLIAQRIGISSTALEEFAEEVFADDADTLDTQIAQTDAPA